MNDDTRKNMRNRKRRIERRLGERHWTEQAKPMFSASNIGYEMGERMRDTAVGGMGAMHRVARRSGLIEAIDRRVHVLKRRQPYHESDHVLNIAYNGLNGGTCLEDIELRRNDECTWMRWGRSGFGPDDGGRLLPEIRTGRRGESDGGGE